VHFLWAAEVWPSAEHAYQAMKSSRFDVQRRIRQLPTAGDAKRVGKRVDRRPDWDDVKLDVMLSILRAKFTSPEMATLLETTGDAELIEGNWWGDLFWGQCSVRWIGENWLGRLLMQVRAEMFGV
jgi:ribA/ribD-fused uncharacterized protein